MDKQSSKYRLLMVEDNPGDARLIKEMLRDAPEGFDLVVETNLARTLQRMPEGPFDLILLDLSLPDSSGLDTFRRVRDEAPDVPTVVLTGLSDSTTAQAAVGLGAQDYLVKGEINDSALHRALRYSLERHRSERTRRSLEKELAQSRKLEAIGQLAAGIAHEINTPTQYVSDNARFLRDALADVVGALRSLEATCTGDEPVPGATIRAILEEADFEYLLAEIPRSLEQSLDGLSHISRIVRAMKEFSHPAGEEKTPVNLNHALETTVTVASNEWKYVAEIQFDLDPELPAVLCLPGEINQVFLNLIVNAAHAIGDVENQGASSKGTITLASRSLPNGLVEIRIADTGCGIEEQFREKVFDPFFTTKEVGKGTGQGLAIAYNVIVQKHGGSIGFDTSPGEGTCFVIRLPANGVPGGTDAAIGAANA